MGAAKEGGTHTPKGRSRFSGLLSECPLAEPSDLFALPGIKRGNEAQSPVDGPHEGLPQGGEQNLKWVFSARE